MFYIASMKQFYAKQSVTAVNCMWYFYALRQHQCETMLCPDVHRSLDQSSPLSLSLHLQCKAKVTTTIRAGQLTINVKKILTS